MFHNSASQAVVGTTSPLFIPRDSGARAIRTGEDYLLVQVHSAQAAFTGSIWERVWRLIVTSQVGLNHPVLGPDPLKAIQRSRDVSRNRAEQLGLSPNLIKLVPAVMTHLSVSIEFILDKENRLQALTGLINDDSFVAAISLAPGGAMVARTVGGLAQKVITSFMPAEERQPILQFSGDFNLATGELRDGYYAILGTRDVENPFPTPLPSLEIRDGELLANGEHIMQWSYIVLDVRSAPARGRELNDGAAWESRLREAEDEASNVGADPSATDDERRAAWTKCRNLLKDAQALLRADPNYLRSEAEAIIKAAFDKCARGLQVDVHKGPSEGRASMWQPDEATDRLWLDIDPHEDLDATLDTYADQVAEARKRLKGVAH